MKAVVLAAGVGRRFGKRTKRMPKCLVPIRKKSLLARYFEAFKKTGISEAVIVVGHLSGLIRRECRRVAQGARVTFVRNPLFRKGSILSLRAASRHLEGGAVIMDADVFFPDSALKKLLRAKKSAFLFDPRSKSAGEEMMILAKGRRPWTISKKSAPALHALGEATGIFRLDAKDAPKLRKILEDFYRKKIHDVEYEEAYSVLAKKAKLGLVPVGNVFWSEMDFESDWKKISAHARRTA